MGSIRLTHPCWSVLWVLLAGLISGCAVGPDYKAPEVTAPDAWHQDLMTGLETGEVRLEDWWKNLDDAILDDLMIQAASGNLDLKAAAARIMEARALLGVASGFKYPTVDGFGSALGQRVSEDFGIPTTAQKREDGYYELGVDAGWELDFWGRVRRSVESAEANYQASIENYRDVMVLLYAEIALNYAQVRKLQAQILYTESNIKAQRSTLQITRDRYKADIAPLLDVHQAELNLARTESNLPTFRTALAQAVHRLGVLLGVEPTTLYDTLSPVGPIPRPPEDVFISIPADMIRQRPDIRQAERNLAARTAQIGVATAELYPRFSLIGDIGFSATSNLINVDNLFWTIGPVFRWSIFNAGRIRSQIKIREAQTEQALLFYENTVLRALEEMENALKAYVEETKRFESLGRSVTAAQKSVDLVMQLYKIGLTDFQNVLDMERSLAQQQDFYAESQGLITQNLVRIYKAMGGGWESDIPEGMEEASTESKP
jgi:multidrug efflux system outer membrane protein